MLGMGESSCAPSDGASFEVGKGDAMQRVVFSAADCVVGNAFPVAFEDGTASCRASPDRQRGPAGPPLAETRQGA